MMIWPQRWTRGLYRGSEGGEQAGVGDSGNLDFVLNAPGPRSF